MYYFLYGHLVHSDRRVTNWCLCLSVSDLQRWRKGLNCQLPACLSLHNFQCYTISCFKFQVRDARCEEFLRGLQFKAEGLHFKAVVHSQCLLKSLFQFLFSGFRFVILSIAEHLSLAVNKTPDFTWETVIQQLLAISLGLSTLRFLNPNQSNGRNTQESVFCVGKTCRNV